MNHEAADGGRAEDDSNMEPPPIDDDVDDDNATDTGSDDDENEEEDDDEEDTSSDDESVVIPTPDDVEHEYTYPQDFEGKSWQDVVPRGHYFRLILDPSCTKIPKKKFQFCKRLIEIVVPKDSCLTTIGHASLNGCSNLQRIANGFPTTLLIIDGYAFSLCTSLKGPLVIPPNVTFLGKSVFYDCTSLNGQLIIPPNVTFLGDTSFANCASLTSVVFEPSTTTVATTATTTTTTTLGIGELCFLNCTGLVSVDFSERIDEYGNALFHNCSSLNRIIIRSSDMNMRFNSSSFHSGECSSSLTIEAYPWLYPKIFASMDNSHTGTRHYNPSYDPSLVYQTFRQYHHRILSASARIGRRRRTLVLIHQYHHRILAEVTIAADGVVTRQHPNGRRRQQLHKRQRLLGP